jgi:enolase
MVSSSQQGQIKTGAPCRSERLAKYNHVDGNVFHHTQLKMRNLTKYDFSYHTQLKMRISRSILPKFKATQYAGQGERKNYPVVMLIG